MKHYENDDDHLGVDPSSHSETAEHHQHSTLHGTVPLRFLSHTTTATAHFIFMLFESAAKSHCLGKTTKIG